MSLPCLQLNCWAQTEENKAKSLHPLPQKTAWFHCNFMVFKLRWVCYIDRQVYCFSMKHLFPFFKYLLPLFQRENISYQTEIFVFPFPDIQSSIILFLFCYSKGIVWIPEKCALLSINFDLLENLTLFLTFFKLTSPPQLNFPSNFKLVWI